MGFPMLSVDVLSWDTQLKLKLSQSKFSKVLFELELVFVVQCNMGNSVEEENI